MKKSIFLIVLSLAFSIFANAIEVENTSVPATASSCINGVIADMDTHETLAGVMVRIEGTDLETLTDLDGRFSFKGLQAGDYDLKLTYISYKEEKVKNIKAHTYTAESLDLKLKSE